MSESASLPMNFGGIEEEQYSSFDSARIVVWPVSYEGTVSYGMGTATGDGDCRRIAKHGAL